MLSIEVEFLGAAFSCARASNRFVPAVYSLPSARSPRTVYARLPSMPTLFPRILNEQGAGNQATAR